MRGNIRGEEKKMKTEQHSYENPNVDKIVANVRAGLKSRADLEFCGCPVCKKALEILGDEKSGWKRIVSAETYGDFKMVLQGDFRAQATFSRSRI